ncbi:MAG TPA: hypothetical protein PLN91_00950 [Rhodanobacteraceae bacterium]|nr:hypothetical protein [Rhodanobacteraceae bacterium]
MHTQIALAQRQRIIAGIPLSDLRQALSDSLHDRRILSPARFMSALSMGCGEVRRVLDDLVVMGYLRTIQATPEAGPWWALTPKGQDLVH